MTLRSVVLVDILRAFEDENYMHWIILLIAILFEAAGTSCMKLSAGCTKPLPTVLMGVFYCTYFFLLTVALKKIQLSIAYPIVCGAGVALIAGIGVVYFRETFSPLKIIGTLAIVGGVIALNIAGTTR